MKLLFTRTLSVSLFIIVLLNTGCATILGHSDYPVTITSNPPAAKITITNRSGAEIYNGVTPATITLKSAAGYFSREIYQVKFKLNGYDDQTITINGTLNGWYFGNLLIGGALGMLIIDPLTGAMYKIEDTNVSTTLHPVAHAQAKLEILDINSLPKAMLKNLVKMN